MIKNQSHGDRSISLVMSTTSVYYNGLKAHLVKKGAGEFVLKANERETFSMEVLPMDYMPKTVEYCQFVNRFLVRVEETGQTWSGEDNFVLVKPKLEIRVADGVPPRIGRVCKIVLKLKNPLEEQDLNECVFAVEAPGMTEAVKRRFRPIEPGETVEVEMEATPWKAGNTTVVATFNADELYNITGTKKATVLS